MYLVLESFWGVYGQPSTTSTWWSVLPMEGGGGDAKATLWGHQLVLILIGDATRLAWGNFWRGYSRKIKKGQFTMVKPDASN
jgi:hypothetical protein